LIAAAPTAPTAAAAASVTPVVDLAAPVDLAATLVFTGTAIPGLLS